MTFHEKLCRLGETMNKAAISRRAGLPPTAFSSYLAKPETVPRGDIALRFARALNVDLYWLLDDSRGWPPVWVNHSARKRTAATAA